MKKLVLILAAALFPCTVLAAGETVTVREAVKRALTDNNTLKAARFDEQAAQQTVAAGRGRYLPHLNLETGAALTNSPSRVFMMKLDEGRIGAGDFNPATLNNPSARGDFHTAVTLDQPLWDRSIGTSVALAAKDAEAATASVEMGREQIAFRVYQAYLEVRRARAMHQIAEQAVADAREHLRLSEVRQKDGVGLKSDRLRAETELAEAEQRQIAAKNDLQVARLRLNLVVGGPTGSALDIVEPPTLAPSPLTEPDLVNLALARRQDLKGGEKQVEKGDLSLRQARDAYFPTVYAGASYQINDRDVPLGWDHDSWSIGVNLRWEIFEGNRRSHDKQRASNARSAAAARLEDARREVSLQVSESLLRRQESAQRLESARKAVAAAEESMRLIAKRFENGLSQMVELMDSEAALNRSRASLVEAENGYAAANAEVYFAAGVFLQEVMR
ncbi:TolC family protein [Geomesophilobacter sediminis]|uniref:TolC family protein n=1 Tax=Geomesophilobacter sediminis TaxID=2798584 RepID=A0A8J7J5I8_9BACT|nr:TolC family protein [Geomesophilobacter sediminis]MBJ6723731.1 TolC family protein [Geomesophilobacter sediminis]